jgi:hypothetical protein
LNGLGIRGAYQTTQCFVQYFSSREKAIPKMGKVASA